MYAIRSYYEADPLALADEIRKAYAIAPQGVVGVNCMVAVTNYDDIVRAACAAGAKVIVSGAGLPLNLPELTAGFPEVALVPIVSSVKAAELIARKWFKTYQRLPDAVVVEEPDTAGGHLGRITSYNVCYTKLLRAVNIPNSFAARSLIFFLFIV